MIWKQEKQKRQRRNRGWLGLGSTSKKWINEERKRRRLEFESFRELHGEDLDMALEYRELMRDELPDRIRQRK